MRRGPVIMLSAVIAVLAAVLALVAWRADASTSAAERATPSDGGARAVDGGSTDGPATVAAPAGSVGVSSPVPPVDGPAATDTVTPVPVDGAQAASGDDPALASAGDSAAAPGGTAEHVGDDPVAAAAGPTGAPPPTADGSSSACPDTGRGAVVDRVIQRAWLCDAGATAGLIPVTSAWSMPDPGTYAVYAKDLRATSAFGGHVSTMTHFVAFTHGERTGARIAFHSVPTLNDGTFVQDLATVGDLDQRGESSGCIRVLPDDAVRIWEWLSIGDEVHVVS